MVGRDADNQIKFSTDDQIIFRVGAGDGVTFKASGEIEATARYQWGCRCRWYFRSRCQLLVAQQSQHQGVLSMMVSLTSLPMHIDHTSVTLTAGTGLTGGGNIAANRTFALDIDGISAALTSGLASTDELVSDAGTVKKMDVSVLQSYLQSNLTFTRGLFNKCRSNISIELRLRWRYSIRTQTDDNVKYTGTISVGM